MYPRYYSTSHTINRWELKPTFQESTSMLSPFVQGSTVVGSILDRPLIRYTLSYQWLNNCGVESHVRHAWEVAGASPIVIPFMVTPPLTITKNLLTLATETIFSELTTLTTA